MKSGNIYSSSDKSIYDALNQSKVTKIDLQELFLRRGIIISKDTKRNKLALMFSRFPHDFEDYDKLSKLLGSSTRRERFTSVYIKTVVDKQDMESAAHKLKETITTKYDAIVDVTQESSGALKIIINYRTTNFNRSEFRQVVEKEAILSVENVDSGLIVRSPSNEIVDDFRALFFAAIEEEIDGDIEIEDISLDYISSAELRSKFFTYLIDNIAGFTKHDVIDVYVYNPIEKAESVDLDVNLDDEELANDIDLGVHISKASLQGVGVLESPELHHLYQKGFYIYKIVWQAYENLVGSDLYEFEVQFKDPEDLVNFSYLVKGFYKYQSIGKHNKTRTQLSHGDEYKINRLLENAALQSKRHIEGLNENDRQH